MTHDIRIRSMRQSDAAFFTEAERTQGWHTEKEKFLLRLRDQEEGRAVALVAECDGEPAGYIHVYPDAQEGPFAGRGWPEIVDFAVLEKFRSRGIGRMLMDAAEAAASRYADTVYLGVGLHSGYGAAQRMYTGGVICRTIPACGTAIGPARPTRPAAMMTSLSCTCTGG